MSNLVERKSSQQVAGFADEVFKALKSSLYPGAEDSSVCMVLEYCKAAKLDPMQKPVHIVAMDVKTNKKNHDGKFIYEKRDVVMPGIALYRIQASRSGQYVGKSTPVYGPNITKKFGTLEITFPEWCEVTVKKMVGKVIAEFTAKELWLENYANKDRYTNAPNSMWAKRTYAQLAKCAEAQALRMGFPDHVTSQPTAEEMEGKTLDYSNEDYEVIEDKNALFEKKLSEAASKRTDSKPALPIDNDIDGTESPITAPISPDFDSVMARLNRAITIAELSDAANMANKLTKPNEKAAALKCFKENKALLEKPPTVAKELEDAKQAAEEFFGKDDPYL